MSPAVNVDNHALADMFPSQSHELRCSQGCLLSVMIALCVVNPTSTTPVVRDGPKRYRRRTIYVMRLLTSFNLAQRQPYKHTQVQVYNRYYNSDYTPYYQYCILHIPTRGSISHVNGSHIYLCHITYHTSIDRNSYYK